jgi:hypothetical protein
MGSSGRHHSSWPSRNRTSTPSKEMAATKQIYSSNCTVRITTNFVVVDINDVDVDVIAVVWKCIFSL